MPVHLEFVQLPSHQDEIDLGKIYAEAPYWLLSPYTTAEQLLQANLQQGTLAGARFNQRLLGAAIVNKQGNRWQVSHLCVREITRMRGVARRLLDELHREAANQGASISMGLPPDRPELEVLAAHLGIAWHHLNQS